LTAAPKGSEEKKDELNFFLWRSNVSRGGYYSKEEGIIIKGRKPCYASLDTLTGSLPPQSIDEEALPGNLFLFRGLLIQRRGDN